MIQLPESLKETSRQIIRKFSGNITSPWLLVDSTSQSMFVMDDLSPIYEYSISTSKYGMGCEQDSFKTPTGAHKIAKKIGHDAKPNEIFVGRVATAKYANIICEEKSSDLDFILTRILWLQGLEQERNCGEGVDSFKRYIYIHGTHEEGLLGRPASHGCVRMSNKDVVNLFSKVDENSFVYIC
ncbi:MAG: L,D-transpeptidase family protein [Gammaproteobacteria bacterium]